jgi:hypothetical protein
MTKYPYRKALEYARQVRLSSGLKKTRGEEYRTSRSKSSDWKALSCEPR